MLKILIKEKKYPNTFNKVPPEINNFESPPFIVDLVLSKEPNENIEENKNVNFLSPKKDWIKRNLENFRLFYEVEKKF